MSELVNELVQKVSTLEAVSHVPVSSFDQLADAVSVLPSQAEVDAKLPLTGGDLTGQLNMGGNRISGLSAALHPTDAVRNSEFISYIATAASSFLPANSTDFSKLNVTRDDISIPAVKITEGAAGGRRAFEINSNRATGANVIFGQTDHAGEMAWQFGGGESFNWIEGTVGKQLSISSKEL